jgi:Ca2+-binding RTX toxin-like protein
VSPTFGNLNVSAAQGKANNITVSTNATGQVIISDTADVVRADGGCAALTPNSVRCDGIFLVRVFAGDLDDHVTNNSSVSTHQFGDAGNDVLTGGSGTDQFFPGVGNDRAIGNGGNDIFNADLPFDGSDDFTGGAGVDTAAYNTRAAALTITLDGVANDGFAGEGDNVRADLENVFGGSGADNITGNASANEFRLGNGADTVRGLGGDDLLSATDGVAGNDTVNGGAGTDRCLSDAGDVETACELN